MTAFLKKMKSIAEASGVAIFAVSLCLLFIKRLFKRESEE